MLGKWRLASGFALLSLLSCALSANSGNNLINPAIAKERRQYIDAAIEVLRNRAEILQAVIDHQQAACNLLREVPAESGARGCTLATRFTDAEREVDSALVALKHAHEESKRDDFDTAEQDLSNANKRLFRARDLLNGQD